jgi:hypothetical protein
VPNAPEPKPYSKGPAHEKREVPRESTPASSSEPKRAINAKPEAATAAARGTDTAAAALPRPAATELDAQLLTPNVLSVRHWDRLLGGALYAATPRLDWASLLCRSFQVDVLACAKCGGRLRVLDEVTEPAMVKLVLETLGMPTAAPRVARARDPTELLGADHS